MAGDSIDTQFYLQTLGALRQKYIPDTFLSYFLFRLACALGCLPRNDTDTAYKTT